MLTANKVIPGGRGLAAALLRRARTVALPWDVRQRSRFEIAPADAQSLRVFLPRGTIVRDGDVLVADDGTLHQVRAAAEPVLVVRTCATHGTPLDLLRAAYHLGNRHVQLELRSDRLLLEPDHVLAALLRRMHLIVSEADEPFEPESGAYGMTGTGRYGHEAHQARGRHGGHAPSVDHDHDHDHHHHHEHEHQHGHGHEHGHEHGQRHAHAHADAEGHAHGHGLAVAAAAEPHPSHTAAPASAHGDAQDQGHRGHPDRVVSEPGHAPPDGRASERRGDHASDDENHDQAHSRHDMLERVHPLDDSPGRVAALRGNAAGGSDR